MKARIPVCEPTLGLKEIEYVQEAITSGWISSYGPFLQRFESEFAPLVGAKYAVAVCNGTVAIHLGLRALKIEPGDEVIVPSFTMVASANAVAYCQARPIFVDADPKTWTMDVSKIREKITPRTKAILTVSIYGHPVDYGAIRKICDEHQLLWIEDGAEGLGSEYLGRPLASYPDITTYSFFANKIITTGEGGMVCMNRDDLWERSRYLRNMAFPMHGERTYYHEEIGFNYRMTNLQAAVGCAQTSRLSELVEMRRKNASLYHSYLEDLQDSLQLPVEESWAKNSYWMYCLNLKPSYQKQSRFSLMSKLSEQGIETRKTFIPMHKQPVFRTDQSLPVSEALSESGFYLPSSSHLTEEEIRFISQALRNAL